MRKCADCGQLIDYLDGVIYNAAGDRICARCWALAIAAEVVCADCGDTIGELETVRHFGVGTCKMGKVPICCSCAHAGVTDCDDA